MQATRNAIGTIAGIAAFLVLTPRSAATAAEPVVRLDAADLAERPTFCAVAEMRGVAAVDGATPATPEDVAEFRAEFEKAWAAEAPWVADRVTPQLVRALSRWSNRAMEKYAVVPEPAKAALRAAARSADKRYVVYEAELDKLPADHAIVFRRLYLYVTYDTVLNRIDRVTVTIRGWREE